MQLSFSALGDLLEEVLAETMPELPTPRRRALEAALLLEDVPGPPPDQRAVALAFLDLLRLLASSGSVLVAVDDLQWLDQPTAATLAFALRRVKNEQVGLLAAVRIEGGQSALVELARIISPEELQWLAIGPLSVGALHRLLGVHLYTTLPRPTLLRLHEQSGGNPFYALEIARALKWTGGRIEPGELLPVPARLEELVLARLAALPRPVEKVLRPAAALSEPDDLSRQGRVDACRERSSAPPGGLENYAHFRVSRDRVGEERPDQRAFPIHSDTIKELRLEKRRLKRLADEREDTARKFAARHGQRAPSDALPRSPGGSPEGREKGAPGWWLDWERHPWIPFTESPWAAIPGNIGPFNNPPLPSERPP